MTQYYTFNPNIPASQNNPSNDQPLMLINNASTNSILPIDHVGFNANNGGFHKAIHFDQTTSYAPAVPVSLPTLFTNTQDGHAAPLPGGIAQLFYYAGSAIQSAGQYSINAANGSTMLLGGIILKWGQFSLAGSDTGPVGYAEGFPTAAFSVIVGYRTAGSEFVYVSSIADPTQFTAVNGSNQPANCYYIAIGN